jgi:hypothetical protein
MVHAEANGAGSGGAGRRTLDFVNQMVDDSGE